MKPRNWFAPGLKTKLSKVATRPTNTTDPGFRTHHAVIINADTPNMSHRMGKRVTLQNMGDTSQLITAHRDDDRLIAAKSRVEKYPNQSPQYYDFND